MSKSRNTIGYIVIVVLLVIAGFISLNLFFRQKADRDILDIRTFPYEVGGWQGEDMEVSEKEYRILETRNLISRVYTNKSEEKIYLFIIYSETNRSVFHPPEVCFIGSGIDIVDKATDNVDTGSRELAVNKLYTEKDGYKELVLYAYKAGSFYTDNYYLQQAYFALNQLLGRGRGGATIRISVVRGGDDETTLTTVKSFMRDTIKLLEEL